MMLGWCVSTVYTLRFGRLATSLLDLPVALRINPGLWRLIPNDFPGL